MTTYDEYLKGTKTVLEESKKQTEPYTVSVAGEEFIVLPNVFSPKYFYDTELFATNLPINRVTRMLEIGPGTGAISVIAIKRGVKYVLAIDINPDAVKNTQMNIEKHCLQEKMEVRHGNLYDSLKEDEKFDVIFWNTPFGLVDYDVSDLEKAVYDPGYKSTERFIKEAPLHLKTGGKLLIGFSSTLGKLDLLEQYAKDTGFVTSVVYETKSTETHPVKFEILEAVLA